MLRAAVASRIFQQLYGPLAPSYDFISSFFFAGEWAVWQRSALQYIKGTDLLEVGYGTGELLLEMCRRGCRPYGIEPSHRMRSVALRKLRRSGCKPILLPGTSSQIPLSDASVDSIVSTFPSAYILDEATWREAWRVLRPAGRYVVVLGGRLRPWNFRSRLLDRFHAVLYGSAGRPTPTEGLAFPGFALTFPVSETERGTTYLLVGTKQPEYHPDGPP